jgi:hypothetical protein
VFLYLFMYIPKRGVEFCRFLVKLNPLFFYLIFIWLNSFRRLNISILRIKLLFLMDVFFVHQIYNNISTKSRRLESFVSSCKEKKNLGVQEVFLVTGYCQLLLPNLKWWDEVEDCNQIENKDEENRLFNDLLKSTENSILKFAPLKDFKKTQR